MDRTPTVTPRVRAAAAGFVFVTILLDWLVVGIMSPVIPKLVLDLRGGDVAAASSIAGVFATAFALVAFVASPILGLLSDRFGRRPVILLSCSGSAVDCLILALAPNIAWLFVGRVLAGATAAGMIASAAYVADVTPPERRAAAFGMISAAFGLGFALGPAVGGLLATFGLRVPFFVAAGLMVTSAVYGLVVLPESLAPAQRHATFAWRRANPLGSLALLRRHRDMTNFMLSLFCSNLAVQAFSVFVLYTIFRFGWSEQMNGLGLTLFGALSVASSLLVGRLVGAYGPRTIATVGFVLGAFGFVCYAFAPNGLVFAIGLPLTGLWSIAGPPVQSAMSARIAAHEQGELQGAIGCVRSIAMIVGPAFFTAVFAAVAARGSVWFTGVPWVCGALLLAGAAWFARRGIGGERPAADRSDAQAVA